MGVTLFFLSWSVVGACAYFSYLRRSEHEEYKKRMKQMQAAHNRSLRRK